MSAVSLNDSWLLRLKKPAQYCGGEVGSIRKDEAAVDVRICLAFPDTYEVGMSHLGLQILYDLANRDPGVWAERSFMPLADMAVLLREKSLPLFSLESRRPLSEFDVLGFSLQYELCATNVLAMLDLGGIPLKASERTAKHPLVIGGGPLALHPEPLADFFDLFSLGDGEELLLDIIACLRSARKDKLTRLETLRRLSGLEGIYVPSLCPPDPSTKRIHRRILPSLDRAPHPTAPIVPHIKPVHDRLAIEVMRGCLHGCRFCQAGYVYRPQRERSQEDVLQIVKNTMPNTGYDEMAFLSLSTADYSGIVPLVTRIRDEFTDTFVSFPSTRIDAMTPEFLQTAASLSHSGFTIAPEAGTQRMRDVINKGISDEQIIDTCCRIFSMGWKSIKLYFMIGLPTETDDDVYGIVDLTKRIARTTRRARDISLSVSTLVPKPHTPFQWAEQLHPDEVFRRYRILVNEFHRTGIRMRYHDWKSIFLEGVLSRGDRTLGRAILRAYQLGCIMDGWTEYFNFDKWLEAFRDAGIDPYAYLRDRQTEEPLPWDHLDCGLDKAFLLDEWRKSRTAATTENCRTGSCSICGVCDHSSIVNINFPAGDQGVSNSSRRLAKQPPPIQRIRLSYHKAESARFLSHLELQLAFQRAIKRARLPVAFSNAIHTQPKLLFGPPLQLGIESNCELADLFLTQRCEPNSVLESLAPTLPFGIRLNDAFEVNLKARPVQAQMKSASYSALMPDETFSAAEFPGQWRELSVERLRAGQKTNVPLKDYVTSVSLENSSLLFTVSYKEDGTSLRPLEVLQALVGNAASLVELRKTACSLD